MDDGGRPQISVKSLWKAADHPKNWFVRFYMLHLWGSSQEAKHWW
jgi:hypothetical protein